jgi:catechol 2,3-dioxygenase-like lactoylglutathione lyase family enzyme
VARITGRFLVILTVSDLERSAAWYRRLLGAGERREHDAEGALCQVVLTEPRSGAQICLVGHPGADSAPFDETRCGLDHLELLVAERSDLDDWVVRLDALGIAHSGITEPTYTGNRMLNLRDPDGIALEFFWAAPRL